MKLDPQQTDRLNLVFDLGHIPEETRAFWASRLDNLPELAQESILSMFEIAPDAIGRLTDLQKRKEDALAKRDRPSWDAIVKDETALMAELLKSPS
ncbi:MAG: hypothetical protein A3A44_02685 [Candidatus Sungbacteria bacterium RIFCSPLOWO2_01_FULL_60_25]|uniref:Uncharacterized protein n=1 Tax=Candidatus Sungbacteria bacterium RIFCSPLOWO2_01_FULL_60_25 TaxID=1802281 RepID=A0A1G2LDF4_9BACT|nr:MAG: hypothetical protein A3A44_02685 [Candidatus Sungbacteria bacterium RIFCSPLOWO2_01_FULL_60_25]